MTARIDEGGCLCGAIRYRVAGSPVARTLCHCQSCRRASGAPSVAWTVFAASDFALLSGKPVNFSSSPSVVRTFCGTCGTPLTYQRESRTQTIDVTTATLDAPNRFAPTCEIWTGEKLEWEALNAALPNHPRSSKPAADENFG
jgi:hypothetical protein